MYATMQEVRDKLGISIQTIHRWRRGSSIRVALPVRRELKQGYEAISICKDELRSYLELYRPDLLDRFDMH